MLLTLATGTVVFIAWFAFRSSDFPGFERLEAGMTRAQAEAAMGRSADHVEIIPADQRVLIVWFRDDERALAVFDRNDKLQQKLVFRMDSRFAFFLAQIRIRVLGW